MIASWRVKPRLVVGEAERYAAFRSARAALAASGTVTLELALSRTPTIVAYRVPKFEEFIARRLINLTTAVLPNLILGENAFPEYFQEDADAGAARGRHGRNHRRKRPTATPTWPHWNG